MNKKITNSLIVGAALLSSGVMSSCSDYDDDIDSLNNRVSAVETSIAELQKKISDGKWITSMEQSATGYVLTLSDGSKLEIKNGTAGKGEQWIIDETTKEWVRIDSEGQKHPSGIIAEGKDGAAGLVGPAGENGKTPFIKNGKWVIEGKKGELVELGSAVGQSSYVIDRKAYWELRVAKENAKDENDFESIILPKTASITNIEVYSDPYTGSTDYMPSLGEPKLYLNIGKNQQGKEVKFNGKTYYPGDVLINQSNKLILQTNPLTADASLYNFTLNDSKGNESLFKVESITKNMSEKPVISRSMTENKGLWDVKLTIERGANLANYNDRTAYSLQTTTLDNKSTVVASRYDINIEIGYAHGYNISTHQRDIQINKEMTWDEFFDSVSGSRTLVADYYLEIPEDQINAASNYGVMLNKEKKTITFTKAQPNHFTGIYIHYLKMNGEINKAQLTVRAQNIQNVTLAKNFEWTVTDDAKKKTVKVAFAEANALDIIYNGKSTSTKQVFSFANPDNVTVDGVKVNANEVNFNTVLPLVEFKKENGQWFAYMTFDETKVFATTYKAQIEFHNDDNNQSRKLEFDININAPQPFDWINHRNVAFFEGNNVKAYPNMPNKNNYSLKEIYNIDNKDWNNIYFNDVVPEKEDTWFASNRYWANIPDYNVNGKSREVTAYYKPFHNMRLNSSTYKFNLEIRSQIFDGKIESKKEDYQVNSKDDAKVKVGDFTYFDVKGEKYDALKDNRVAKVEVAIAEGQEYLAIKRDAENGTYVVFRKDKETVIVTPVTCKVKVIVTDVWGKKKECTANVIVK